MRLANRSVRSTRRITPLRALNAQVYNRCIGVRYCGNNCPYTARQFNWFDPHWDPPLEQQLNPDVTVRQNGIMEKCTFCVQRIRQGKEQAERDGRPVRDGDITLPALNPARPPRWYSATAMTLPAGLRPWPKADGASTCWNRSGRIRHYLFETVG